MKFNSENSNILEQLNILNDNKDLYSPPPYWRKKLNNISSEALDFLDLHYIDYSPYIDDEPPYLLLKTGEIERAVKNEIKQLNSPTPYLSSWLPVDKLNYLSEYHGINTDDIILDHFMTNNILNRIIHDLRKENLSLVLKIERNGMFKFYDDEQEVGIDIYPDATFTLKLFGCLINLNECNFRHLKIIQLISEYWKKFQQLNSDLFVEVDLECYVKQYLEPIYLTQKNRATLALGIHDTYFNDEDDFMSFYQPLLEEWNQNFSLHSDRLSRYYNELICKHTGSEMLPEFDSFVNYDDLIRSVSSAYIKQGCLDYEALECWDWNWLETISLRLQINCEIATEDYDVFEGNDNALLMAAQTPVYTAIWSDVRFLAIYDHIMEIWGLDIDPNDFDATYHNLFGKDEIMKEVKEIFLIKAKEDQFYDRLSDMYQYVIKTI